MGMGINETREDDLVRTIKRIICLNRYRSLGNLANTCILNVDISPEALTCFILSDHCCIFDKNTHHSLRIPQDSSWTLQPNID